MQLQSLGILEVSNMPPFLLTSINLINVLYNPNCSSGIYAQGYRVKNYLSMFCGGLVSQYSNTLRPTIQTYTTIVNLQSLHGLQC